ncbi:MAG: hypothetical protein WB580_21790 [Candidatus Binataceae bacterium]
MLVEHLARITQIGDMDPRLFELFSSARQPWSRLTGFVLLAMGGNSTHQIEHVEFDAGMTQQMGEIPETLGAF